MRKIAASALAATLLLGACGGGGGGGFEGSQLTVSGSEYKFEGPSSVEGGAVRIRFDNTGKEDHLLQFVQLTGGKTSNDAVKSLKKAGESGALADFIVPAGGTAEVAPGSSSTLAVQLPPGSYAMLCFVSSGGPPHFALGMVADLEVTEGEGTLPAAAKTVTATEYAFGVPSLPVGTTRVEFRNDGPKEPHLFALERFPKKVSLKDVQDAIEVLVRRGRPPKGFPDPEEVGGAGALDPGGRQITDITLEAGVTYIFACFLSDRKGGPPHIAKGMVEAFRV